MTKSLVWFNKKRNKILFDDTKQDKLSRSNNSFEWDKCTVCSIVSLIKKSSDFLDSYLFILI